MKYLVGIIFLFFFVVQSSYSQEICNDSETKNEIYGYIQVQGNVNMRDDSCTTGSKILDIAETNQVYYVIGETQDFYLVEQNFSENFWIWKGAVEVYHGYQEEYQEAKSFVESIENILQQKDRSINRELINTIQKITDNYTLSENETILFENIFYHLENTLKDENLVWLEDKRYSQENGEENNSEDESQDENIQNTDNNFRIDMQAAKNYWLELNNAERNSRGLYDYTFHQTLHNSAQVWSDVQAENSFATHKRSDNDMYYDYQKITHWLGNQGVTCKNVDTFTHTENVAWGAYYCDQDDCTQELQKAMKRTFDFYMSEENDKYRPHFLSIVNEYFKKMGVGITLKETQKNKYEFYMTIHYCTELE